MKSVQEPKHIYEFSDYRELLKYLYNLNKSKNSKFSYRYFARLAGFAGGSFLKIVIDGGSDLSDESIAKIARGFKLSQDETRFFRSLVFLNQAKSVDEKQKHAQEILKVKAYRKTHPLSEAQYLYYSEWYFIPVREIVGSENFREDYEWIAKRIIPNITAAQVEKAVKALLTIGLLTRDENNRLMQSTSIVVTPDEVVSSAIGLWHREMMKKAAESIDNVPRDLRDISAVTFRVSRANLKRAKEMVQKFRKELAEEPLGGTGDSVYELNMQLFPLTDFFTEADND